MVKLKYPTISIRHWFAVFPTTVRVGQLGDLSQVFTLDETVRPKRELPPTRAHTTVR